MTKAVVSYRRYGQSSNERTPCDRKSLLDPVWLELQVPFKEGDNMARRIPLWNLHCGITPARYPGPWEDPKNR